MFGKTTKESGMNFLTILLRGITLVPGVIQGVESLFGSKTGAQKKDAVLSIVSSSLNLVDAVSSKKIADSASFTAGLGQVIDGVVACLNASVWAKAAK
jgi:hypothetical protein